MIGVFLICLFCQEEQKATLRRVVVTANVNEVIGPISPYIYGANDCRPEAWTDGKRHTFGRLGGNRWTAYNWESNASNAGKDWHHQNDGYLSDSDEPAKAVTDRLDVIQKHGAPALVTVPIQGWVAADKNADGDVAKSGKDYLTTRFFPSLDGGPRTRVLLPNKDDRAVYQDQFVAFLERRRKERNSPPIWYSLDNEPDLWHDTHPRIQPTRMGRRELIERSVQFATAIKAAAPESLVFGPGVSGWSGITRFGVQNDFDFIDEYLSAFGLYRREGKRLLDVLDVHWYSEHRGGGRRVTVDDGRDEVAWARIDAPRSLYDGGFAENSWIVKDVIHRPIELLPRLRDSIKRYNSQVKLAVTEYYFGGGEHPSGAVAQADALGAFGKYGVFAANLFHLGRTDDRYILAAFDLFRNYDGKGGSFGDTAVETWRSDDEVAAYAAISSDRVTIVLLNRWISRLGVRLEVDRKPAKAPAHRFQIAAPHAKVIPVKDVDLSDLILPPMSATLIVLPR
jgi:hypothetical protein